ncbi:MAG: PEP-CTERM sorting domain-containing protein [Phycisphaerae bacterium]|nr:PEP-CTERM sorting domain-containing protein [Phycisphaerae bacterium]
MPGYWPGSPGSNPAEPVEGLSFWGRELGLEAWLNDLPAGGGMTPDAGLLLGEPYGLAEGVPPLVGGAPWTGPSMTPTPVPEPGTLGLLLLAGVTFLRRR